MNFIKKTIIKLLLRSIGKTYDGAGLVLPEAKDSPFSFFADWFQQALKEMPDQANIMTLSTVSPEGRPAGRLLLLKGYDERGFIFFTNYQSAKANDLEHNPWCSMAFWWERFFRQVRIKGPVEKLSAQESDDYFKSRDRGSQLSAWASAQSKVIANRAELEAQVQEYELKFKGKEIPRPDFWGGYRLLPEEVEFWQGRLNRRHDRLRYSRQQDGSWKVERLAP